jgi:hypothetical protein
LEEEEIMKLLRVIGASGVLLWSAAMARAEVGPNPETSGAVTTPSGTETTTPPPATYDNGTPATAPAAEPAAPPASTTQDMAVPDTSVGAGETGVAPLPAESPSHMAVPPPIQSTDTRDVGYAPQPVPSRVGVGLLLGGGYERFTNDNIRNQSGEGGYWNVRAIVGTREFIGAEAAYVGDARGLTGLGFSNNARLISNGLEGVLRLNVPVARGYSLIEPFGFVGVGWQHYVISNNNTVLSDISARDDILTVPFGGGLEFAYRGFMADARFTYRETYYNNLLGRTGGDLNNWGVGGQIGFEF